MKYIIIFTLLPFIAMAQYNPDAKNGIRLVPTFNSLDGIGGELSYELFFKPRHSLLFSGTFSSRNKGYAIGYRYNIYHSNKLEMAIGLDIRRWLFSYESAGFSAHWNTSLNPTLEVKYNFNKHFNIITGISSSWNKDRFNLFGINRLNVGVGYKF